MCFRFDGQYGVAAHRPDKCRERVLPAEPAAAARLPVDSSVEPTLLSATMKTALILVGKRVGKAV